MTILEKVSAQIDDLISAKNAQLADINARLDELSVELDSAKSAMDAATSVLDEDAFAAAESRLKKAETKIKMCESRREQIASRDYISEDESEKTIDALLAYENTIAAEFKSEVSPLLDALEKLRSEYVDEVKKTEEALRRWTSEIRETYTNRTGSLRIVDGQRTNRFDSPQKLHAVQYNGGEVCHSLGKVLLEMKSVMRKY